MDANKVSILIIVEGEKTDYELMKALLEHYKIDKKYEILSYKTNIYALYNKMFKDKTYSTTDKSVLYSFQKDV